MIWLIVIVGIGILIFFVLRAAALNKTPPLERVEPGTILTPAGAARAEAEKYDKELEEKYFQSPLTKRIIASISDGTGRLPEQIDVYEDRVTGRTEGAVRAFDFLTERVPKLEKKGFAYRDKNCCGDYDTFYEALSYVLTELSKKIAGDGEGCTCLFEVQVKGASTKEQARILAKSIVTSNLTKAAIFGHDANWGRILCAMGYSGVDFEPEKVDIFFESNAGKLQIVKDGTATDYSEEKATEILSQNPVTAIADIKQGNSEATAWGCDLTFDYVKINADYRS